MHKLHIVKFWGYIEMNEQKFHGKVNRLSLYRFTSVLRKCIRSRSLSQLDLHSEIFYIHLYQIFKEKNS